MLVSMARRSTIAKPGNTEATMNIHDLSGKILSDMWEYGRLVLILVGFLAAYGFVISRRNDEQERTNVPGELVLIGLSTVGIFVLFSFLNVQASNIIALMRAAPSWGCFSIGTTIAAIIVCGTTLYQYFADLRTEKASSILNTSEPMITGMNRSMKIAWLLIGFLLSASIVWLWHLSAA
jgi:hypothetical protein